MRSLQLILWSVLLALLNMSAQGADTVTTRIISLVPSATEVLFEIGAGDLVVGVSDYCIYPPEAREKPRMGALLNPSLEKVLLARPTLVVTYRAQSDLRDKLSSAGIKSWSGSMDTLEEITSGIVQLGGLAGCELRAAALVSRIWTAVEAMRKSTSAVPRPKCLLVLSRDASSLSNVFAAAPNSYHGQLLEAAGGSNVAPQFRVPTVPMSKEQIILTNPELIIDMSVVEGGRAGTAYHTDMETWQALETVEAVRRGHVRFYSDQHALVPGVSAITTLAAFRAFLEDTSQHTPAPPR